MISAALRCSRDPADSGIRRIDPGFPFLAVRKKVEDVYAAHAGPVGPHRAR
jgi:hypothetical protein